MTPRSLLGSGRLAGQPILGSQSDERLVALARAGCEPAFEAIVRRYRRPLRSHCARVLGDERAEDAVQQAFVRAYESMMATRQALNLRPWLYRIAHNTALNALRDRALPHESLDDRHDGVERPDQAWERGERLREVFTAVQALPALQRDALLLRELEGRSYDEIAAELGVSGGSVRQALHRARMTLRSGASALTPMWLLVRLSLSQGRPVADRLPELIGGGAGAGGAAAKLCATALVAGAVVGGAATLPSEPRSAGADASRPGAARRSPATGPAAESPRTLGGAQLASEVAPGRHGEAGSAGDSRRREGAHDGGVEHAEGGDRSHGPFGPREDRGPRFRRDEGSGEHGRSGPGGSGGDLSDGDAHHEESGPASHGEGDGHRLGPAEHASSEPEELQRGGGEDLPPSSEQPDD
jgi:RNA polymerase sigma factor (sigma-70 family)